ncbi:hypothetical protein Ahia01_000911100 [Argonauta hians]
MKLLLASDKGAEITAMSISPNRQYTAFGLKYEKPSIAILDIFTFRKKKVLVCPEMKLCQVSCLSFSSDSRCIVAVCDDPLRTLFYWSWEKGRLLLSSKITKSTIPETIHFISFNPQDHLNVYLFGDGLLKSIRFVESSLLQWNFPKIEPRDFKCFTWDTNERLLVGTDTCKILFIEGTDLRLEINVLQHLNVDIESAKTHGITAIVSYYKGFIIACGTTYVHFFDRTDDKDSFQFARNVMLPSDALECSKLSQQVIKWMVVNPSEEVLVVSTDMKQIYSTLITQPESKYVKQLQKFDTVVHPFHYKPITGCSASLWKPLVATSSLDGTIKVWNYKKCTLELSKNFAEEIYSISMHPTGLFLLAGFGSKLRFMYILRDDLKIFMEFNIRQCTHCNFSQGGHRFAAVYNNLIHVYSSVTFEKIANLKGHNGRVQSTAWFSDDNNLVSCGLDGAVYDWEIKTGKRIGQCVLKSCAYSDVVVNSETRNVYAVGSDNTMKEIFESDIVRTFSSGDLVFTSIALSSAYTMLFVGTNKGELKMLEHPFPVQGKWVDYPCHDINVTHVTFTENDNYLVSVSNDCSIAIWKVNLSEARSLKREPLRRGWTEEILIPRSDLEEKTNGIAELKSRVEELNMENEYQMHLKDMSYNEKIKDMTESFIQEMESLKTQNQCLENDRQKLETRHDEELAEIFDKHNKELHLIETFNERRLLEEYEKFKDLHNRLMKQQEEHDQHTQELEDKQEHALEKLKSSYQEQINQLMKKLGEHQEENVIKQKEYDEMKRQIEEDADLEITYTKTDYEQQLYFERYSNLKGKDENSILKKKLSAFPKELKESKDECKKYRLEMKRQNLIISNLEKDIQTLKKEIQKQDYGFEEDEKQYYERKLKRHEIEKLKCDLEYSKIIELRKQIEYRQTDIGEMKEQIKAMQGELENFTRQFILMDYTTVESKQKLSATSQELTRQRMSLHRKTALLDRFCADLIDCTSFIQDPQKLKSSIKVLHSKYIDKKIDTVDTKDPNVHAEWARQRKHFEYTLHKMQYQINRGTKHSALENEVLVNKCNKIGELLQIEREKNRRFVNPAERSKEIALPRSGNYNTAADKTQLMVEHQFD